MWEGEAAGDAVGDAVGGAESITLEKRLLLECYFQWLLFFPGANGCKRRCASQDKMEEGP